MMKTLYDWPGTTNELRQTSTVCNRQFTTVNVQNK